MPTKPTTSDPFELHCGVCQHVYFQEEWSQTPICSKHGKEVDVRPGDICAEFREGPTQKSGDKEQPATEETGMVIVEAESLDGTTGPFYAVYDGDTKQTWFCSNCESVDLAVDPMGRLKCNRCGNVHRSKEWDSAYL